MPLSTRPSAVKEVLLELVAEGVFPGAVVLASRGGEIAVSHAVGSLSVALGAASVREDTIYELASVTKVFSSTAVLSLMDQRLLGLEEPLGRYLPNIPEDKRRLTVRQLLVHSAGLPLGQEIRGLYTDPDQLREALLTVQLLYPPGTAVSYSSVGYLYLGWLIEAVTSMSLDQYIHESVLRPCGAMDVCFLPPSDLKPRIAPTEYEPELGGFVHGEVLDREARLLGGVAGHAGLFGTAASVWHLGQALLNPDHPVLKPASRHLLYEDLTGGLFPSRSAAFVINDPVFAVWDSQVFSHTGFNGTSICLVPEPGVVAVLLSNRVNPTRQNDRSAKARTAVHRALRQTIDAQSA